MSEFRTEQVESLSDLRGKARGIIADAEKKPRRLRPSFIFRGQMAVYPLSTSLQRACQRLDGGLRNAPDLERRCIREFKRRLHHYYGHVPGDDHTLEWLSLMQHHGAPTRLSDWTYSVDVACFFALEQTLDAKAKEEAEKAKAATAVWMMNGTWCREATAAKFDERERQLLEKPIEYGDEPRLAKLLIGPPPVACVFPLNPFRLNERLTLQKGVFLCTGDVSLTLESNICALTEHDSAEHLVRFVLPWDARDKALEELYDMNITRATLFPGLDGFAQSLKMTLGFLERGRESMPD